MKRNKYARFVGLGIALGGCLGVFMENIPIGAGMGAIVGASIMLALTMRDNRQNSPER